MRSKLALIDIVRSLKLWTICSLAVFPCAHAHEPHIEADFEQAIFYFFDMPVPSYSGSSTKNIEKAFDQLSETRDFRAVYLSARQITLMQLDLNCYFPKGISTPFQVLLYKNAERRMDEYQGFMHRYFKLSLRGILKGNNKSHYKAEVKRPYCRLTFMGYEKAVDRQVNPPSDVRIAPPQIRRQESDGSELNFD